MVFNDQEASPEQGTQAFAAPDSGLQCLLTIAGLHGISADTAMLRHQFGQDHDFDTTAILLAASSLGLSAKSVCQDPQRLNRAPLPAISQDKSGRYFIIAK